MPNTTTTLHIRSVATEVARQLRILCATNGITMAEAIAYLVEQHRRAKEEEDIRWNTAWDAAQAQEKGDQQ